MNENVKSKIEELAGLLERAGTVLRELGQAVKDSGKVYLDREIVGQVISGQITRCANPGADGAPYPKKPE